MRRPIGTNLLGSALVVVGWVTIAFMIVQVGRAVGLSSHWSQGLIYLALFLATLLVTRLYDRMPAAWTGLGLHKWTGRELGLGLLLGGGMALLAWFPIAIAAGVSAGEGWDWLEVYYWLIPMTISAAGEELLFRGYLFQRGVEIVGPVVATFLASVLFALAHLGNPGATPMALAVIFLGGIFFALGYLRTGSLWLPIGAHIAWNIILAKVLGLPVSGQEFGQSLLRTPTIGPSLLTGHEFGPEGGLVAVAALAVGIALLAKIPLFTFSPYVYATVFKAKYER